MYRDRPGSDLFRSVDQPQHDFGLDTLIVKDVFHREAAVLAHLVSFGFPARWSDQHGFGWQAFG